MRFDDHFDLEEPDAQAALLHACDSLPQIPGLQVQPGSTHCMVTALAEWAAALNISFPMPRQQFHEAFPLFIASQPLWLSGVSFDPLCRSTNATSESPTACEGEGELSWRLRHVAVSFRIEIGKPAPAHVLRSLCNDCRVPRTTSARRRMLPTALARVHGHVIAPSQPDHTPPHLPPIPWQTRGGKLRSRT